MNNMELWNKVETTDPKYTKAVSFGKYKFTDIDAHWNLKRATELWGPYGSTWGLMNCAYQHICNTPELTTDSVWLTATFKYPQGEFPIAVDMPYEPKGEVLKKLQTAAIGKALSRLGFSADVYMGMFDDSQYVKEMEQKYGDSDNTNAVDRGYTAGTVPKQQDKRVKRPDPDPVASGILGKLAQAYMDLISNDDKYKGMMVDFRQLCKVVYDTFGKYPTKPDSISTIMESLDINSVLVENDFAKGL